MPFGALPIGYDELLLTFSNSIEIKIEYFDCINDEENLGYRIQNLVKVD